MAFGNSMAADDQVRMSPAVEDLLREVLDDDGLEYVPTLGLGRK